MSFEIPDGFIYLNDAVNENIKISLLSFNFNSDWSEINDDNNAFVVKIDGVSHVISIENGNYPFSYLGRTITNLANGLFSCKWDLPTNKLVFTCVEPMEITFINNSWQILGFNPTETPTGNVIVSSLPLVPRQNTELYVLLNNVTVGDGNTNYSNLEYRELIPSTILSMIPINVAPYQTAFVDNTIFGQATGVYVSNEKINTILFLLWIVMGISQHGYQIGLLH
jgi:hypothetical protein